MSNPPRARYRTTNWPAYNASLKRRDSPMVWLAPELTWQAAPSGRSDRPAVFRDADIQFCLTKLAQLDWSVPDYSTLSRRQKTPSVAITARPSQGGLHLLVDSTGVKMLGEGEWKIKNHGADYRRQWRKVHLGVDAQTLEIQSIEVTDNAIGDAPMLPQLLAQIPEDELLCSVSIDGVYDTKACHETIADRKATAIILTRRNAKPWAESRARA